MNKLRLTFACWEYDRTRALAEGSVRPDGIELTYLTLPVEETFFRMMRLREFDASEMSLSSYTASLNSPNPPFIAIPVFPSRFFRHSCIFISAKSGIRRPEDLKGKRVGVPEYQMTAPVWIRGILADEYGVKPTDVEWVQGRADRIGHKLPDGVRLTMAPQSVELGDLLARGDIDFMISANNPLSFRRGAPNVRRLFPNYAELEKDYYRRTKIYPIMHTVVIRRDIYDRDPWVALSLYKALVRAKHYSQQLMAETGSPKASFAWLQPLIEEEQSIIGKDWYPYGIEANRESIEALLQYSHEQGLSRRRVKLDELFAPSTMRDIPLADGQHV